jgi:predicted nucleotidyltransferase
VEHWAKLRDAWLDATASALAVDPRVVGWGLVGSFGRGEADTWSDLDLLVFVHDGNFDEFTSFETNDSWSTAAHVTDARRNAPAGATSVGSLYIRDGLPIGVDWYVYPASMAAWPDDCSIRYGADTVPKTTESFAVWNARGPRQQPLDLSTTEQRLSRLSMAPIAAKYIARGSPSAGSMIEFLGGLRPGDDRRDQLAAMRERVAELGDGAPVQLVSAINRFLSVVESSIDELEQ